MAVSPFFLASIFILHGVNLIEESDWNNHFELCLQLFNFYIETIFIFGVFRKITIGIDLVLDYLRCLQDSLRANNILIKFLFNQKN